MKMQHLQKSVFISTILLGFPMAGGTPAVAKGPGGGITAETAGNNLSFPVIWAEEGITKVLPGTPGMTPELNGGYWYQWGTNGEDPNVTPASCAPDPDQNNLVLNPAAISLCNDGVAGQVNLDLDVSKLVADNPLPPAKAYLQKDPLNIWQAGTANASIGTPVDVDGIDWGDNLESVDWYTRSQVRVEVVLFKDLVTPMTEYEMRHTSGWGIDEVHGLAKVLEPGTPEPEGLGTQATIYSPCARLAIQKFPPTVQSLVWNPEIGEWTGLYPSIYQAKDGTDNFPAEINVKGRMIYGFTWNVGQMNDKTGGTADGDYRITFSLDETCGTNTTFDNDTHIIVPLEEEVVAAALAVETASTDEGGGVAKIDDENNLTYIDVSILPRSGGGGGGSRR